MDPLSGKSSASPNRLFNARNIRSVEVFVEPREELSIRHADVLPVKTLKEVLARLVSCSEPEEVLLVPKICPEIIKVGTRNTTAVEWWSGR